MKQGALIYDPCLDRMDIRFGLNTYLGGLHCGECFDVWTGSQWEATRIVLASGRNSPQGPGRKS